MISGFQRAPLRLCLTERKNTAAVIDKRGKEAGIKDLYTQVWCGKAFRAPVHLATTKPSLRDTRQRCVLDKLQEHE